MKRFVAILLAGALIASCTGTGAHEAFAQTIRSFPVRTASTPHGPLVVFGKVGPPTGPAVPTFRSSLLPVLGLLNHSPGIDVPASGESIPAASVPLLGKTRAMGPPSVPSRVAGLSREVSAVAAGLASPEASDSEARHAGERLEALLTGALERPAKEDGVELPEGAGAVPSGASLSPPSEPRRGPLGLIREMALGEREFAPLTRPHRRQINIARALLVLKAVLSTASAYSIGAVVDAAIAHSLPGTLLWLGALTGLMAAKAVQHRLYSRATGSLRVAVRREFRIQLFSRILGLAPERLGGEKPHGLAARLARDTGSVTIKNVSIPIEFPYLVIQLGLGVGFLMSTSWQLALVVLAFIPLLAFLSWRYGRRISALQEEASTRQAKMTRKAGELLERGREIADEGERAAAVESYAGAVRKNERTFLSIIKVSANFNAVQEFLQGFASEALVLGVGLMSFLLLGAPSVGQVMALRGYAKDLRGAVDGMLGLYTDSKDAEGATKRVRELWRAGESPRNRRSR